MYDVAHRTNDYLAIGIVTFVSATLIFVFAYFLPAICAWWRDHPNTTSITLLNLFLGWTLIGWVISLVWAFSRNAPASAKPVTAKQEDNPARMACPHCAELILLEAKVCKHCGRDVFPSVETFADVLRD